MTEGLDYNTQDFIIMDSELEWTTDPLVNHMLDPNLSLITNFPVTTLGPPNRTDYSGPYQFSVEIKAEDTHKKKYLYSHKLNCIYVDRKCNFPIHFNWKTSDLTPLYVRATAVFSDEAQAEKRVETCFQHKLDKSLDLSAVPNLNEHVLQSSRSGTEGVFYCGFPSRPDSWYSALVEFPVGGPKMHAYYFFCKNSCPSGINRRGLGIIFTLEDSSGMVHGRQYVGARVCSCPRRDMERDEKMARAPDRGKRRLQHDAVAPAPVPRDDPERIKLEGTTDYEITLPPLKVVGLQPMITGLKVIVDMMKQAESLTTDPQTLQNYKHNIDSFENYLKTLENK